MNDKDKMMESDLYRPLYNYLTAQGYTVRGEVKDCDVAAVKDGELTLIELKKSLTLGLLVQATERQKITESVYVGIPRPTNMRKWMLRTKEVHGLLRRLEIGLILISHKSRKSPVEILFHPVPFQPRKNRGAKRVVLTEIERRSGDFNVGGSCRRKICTAYRENAVHIACQLVDRGPLSPKHLRKLGTGEKTLSILYRNVYGWFERIDKGIYAISPKGREELAHYPELVSHYRANR